VRDLNDSDGRGAVKYKVVVAPPSRGLLGREEGKGGVADPPSLSSKTALGLEIFFACGALKGGFALGPMLLPPKRRGHPGRHHHPRQSGSVGVAAPGQERLTLIGRVLYTRLSRVRVRVRL
jgi:hypothetical protein